MPFVDFNFLTTIINFQIEQLLKFLSDYGASYAGQKDDMIDPSIKALLEIKGVFNATDRERLNFDFNERYDVIKYNINKLEPENQDEAKSKMIEMLENIELSIDYYFKSYRELQDPESRDSGTGGKRKSRKSRKGRKGRKFRKSRRARR